MGIFCTFQDWTSHPLGFLWHLLGLTRTETSHSDLPLATFGTSEYKQAQNPLPWDGFRCGQSWLTLPLC